VLSQAKKRRGSRALYLWGALGLVAFVLGGIAAFLATDAPNPGQDANAPAGRSEGQAAGPHPSEGAPLAKPASTPIAAPPAVRLDDLPVEPKHKH